LFFTDEASKERDSIIYLMMMENAYEMIYRTVAKPFLKGFPSSWWLGLDWNYAESKNVASHCL
jgi:hypothetical protein